ncbi:MAG: homoserine kinase [Chloroflexi bacterium]|nr:homoserine kinase [Chloroflexota bacterium]
MTHQVQVLAPATVANLGPGFDILGMAVTELGDIVTATQIPHSGTSIASIRGDDGKLPRDPTRNTAGIAAEFVRRQIAPLAGVELAIEKGLPLASGLGSSAASAVAAAVAVNTLFGSPLQPADLLPALLAAEAAVSGPHLDNAAPSLYGGIVLISGETGGAVSPIVLGPALQDLSIALITPDIAVPTAQARAALPETVPFGVVVQQTSALAQLIDAIYRDDVGAFCRATMGDRIVEPARQPLIPHFRTAHQAALDHGAAAAIISGAGPTLCTFSTEETRAQEVGSAVRSVYREQGIDARVHVVRPAPQGARVI